MTTGPVVFTLAPPPPGFGTSREALRALASYVIAPASKARTGRIGLRPTGDGFGTPVFADGTCIVIRGDRLVLEPERDTPITTLRSAAEFLEIVLSSDPGVGHDLPPFTPDAELAVDDAASRWLGAWYAFGAAQLARLTSRIGQSSVSEAQLWPEHFDVAVTIDLGGGAVNVGCSPGDNTTPEPYVYVGPHDLSGLGGEYWNAPFGAVLGHGELRAAADADEAVASFIDTGLRLVDARSSRL